MTTSTHNSTHRPDLRMAKAPVDNGALVQVKDLHKHFPVHRGLFSRADSFIHAVDGVSFAILPDQSLGLVGESGCGKTTTGKLLTKLYEPTAGHMYVRGGDGKQKDLAALKGPALKRFRRRVQMIFQDPYESMNPRRTIFDTVAEPLKVQDMGTLAEREERVAEMLALVGLVPPAVSCFVIPTSCRVGNGSGWPSPALWWWNRCSSSPTSRPPCWTYRSVSASWS
jgi:ABC-type glutathione transport system ATPase component